MSRLFKSLILCLLTIVFLNFMNSCDTDSDHCDCNETPCVCDDHNHEVCSICGFSSCCDQINTENCCCL